MINHSDLMEILSKYYGSSYFYGNAIPEKKLRNARTAMNVAYNKQVYALYDATIFGSAKEGACFTDKEIYYRSSSETKILTYEELAKGTLTYDGSDLKFNGKWLVLSLWLKDLIIAINKLNAPIDIAEAKNTIYQGDYDKGLKLLASQEKYVKNTPLEDVIEYRKLYIEAYLGLNDINTAESLLTKFKNEYGDENDTILFVAETEATISAYRQKYAADVDAINEGLANAKRLSAEGNSKDALHILYNLSLREDFPIELKKQFYDVKITVEIAAEEADFAEDSINEAYENNILSSSEKDFCADRVQKLRALLHERYLNEQRANIQKNIDMAKMFEKHGILESASDTINAAISSAPTELAQEKTDAFKVLVDLLLAQYEYEQIYELRKFYQTIAKDELLGYCLSDRVETHRSEHLEEYYTHLYNKAIYYMQTGKFQDAHKHIEEAKAVKCTFDICCAEVNLAMLEFKYAESRSLLDSLKADQGQYTEDGVAESIAHYENQYSEMVNAISTMLKVYAITDNIDAILANDGYDGFVDADGLNLPSIAARFANHNVIDALSKRGYNCEFTRFMNGFGIAFLAAMQLDLEAFSDFIRRRIAGYEEYNCVINEELDVIFPITAEIHRLHIENGIDYETAADVAIKDLYDKCILFFASLLDSENFDAVCAGLECEKTRQTAAVEQMKAELPAIMQVIDAECESKCTQLRSAMQEIKSLLLDVPDSREEKADAVASDLETSVISAIEFANKNAQIMKNEKEWQIKKCANHIEKIQSRISMWTSMDRDAIVRMFKIPAAAVSYGEFDETCNMMSMTLGRNTIQVSMSQDLATALTETPDKVSIESNVSVVFNSSNQLVVTHQYVYSTEGMSSSAEFISIAQLQCNSVAEGILESLLPKLAD